MRTIARDNGGSDLENLTVATPSMIRPSVNARPQGMEEFYSNLTRLSISSTLRNYWAIIYRSIVMAKLAGKVALVTGGNSGMGLATARLFAAEGAKVIITGRRQAALDEAAKTVGASVLTVQGDVAKMADLDRLFATIKNKFGHLDILFANAGLGQVVPLGQVTEEQ